MRKPPRRPQFEFYEKSANSATVERTDDVGGSSSLLDVVGSRIFQRGRRRGTRPRFSGEMPP